MVISAEVIYRQNSPAVQVVPLFVSCLYLMDRLIPDLDWNGALVTYDV